MNAKKIVLPLNHASADSSPAALQQLASDCSPATFGRGSQDILDPSFRQAGKMEPANFATTFHPADLRIITLIERILLPSVINGKENSISTLAPQDSSRAMWTHHDRSDRWGPLLSASQPLSEMATFSSVTGANRWILTGPPKVQPPFNGLLSTAIALMNQDEPASSKVIPSSLVEPWTLTIYGQLDALLHNPQFLPNGGVLGIYYAHAYAHISKVANTNLPLTLKGSDLVLYSVLHALGATVSIQPVLEVDKGDYNWGHGLETEDGELVGEQLHPYHQSSSSTEYDPLD
ncbi:hypothetical protein G4B11_007514 [Aspergillus flavus]|nr:hypothetical protein G4B11_007514 [Aspergillus flavus]